MSYYYGTEAQQRLQRKSDRLTPWIMRTPGACLTGRVLGSDDPDRLGWEFIRKHLVEDGAFSFRWIDPAGLDAIRRRTSDLNVTLHGWEGYCSDADALRDAIAWPMSRDLPDGLTTRVANATTVAQLQAFYAAHGLTPLSGAVLIGENCEARSILICDDTGAIAAAGFVGMMQNAHSPLHDCAWAGLIACSPAHRGKGLGRRITCDVIRAALDDLGARRVMGFAAAENTVSKAMLQGCGLRPSGHASYVTTLSDTRFTV